MVFTYLFTTVGRSSRSEIKIVKLCIFKLLMPFLSGRLLSAEHALKTSPSLNLSQEYWLFSISLLDQNLVLTKSYLVILASVRWEILILILPRALKESPLISIRPKSYQSMKLVFFSGKSSWSRFSTLFESIGPLLVPFMLGPPRSSCFNGKISFPKGLSWWKCKA